MSTAPDIYHGGNHAMTARQQLILIWLLLGSMAAGIAALQWPAAHLGDELLPVGNDSFYHARRILDTANDPSSFYEFDKRIHAPEGSLLTWPWGYDYFMGRILRLGLQVSGVSDPLEILIWIPVAAVFISIGLVLLLARRLQLSVWAAALVGFCAAVSPLTQTLHAVGVVDHHFAEYICVLLALCAGLHWLADTSSARRAAATGLVLGIAPAVHNGMFILQIPILVTLLAMWLQGRQFPRGPVLTFGIVLIASTTAILVPSLPFRLGRFEYFTLSWFHLYVAVGTTVAALILTLPPRSKRSLLLLVGAGLLLVSPLVHQMVAAKAFLTGSIIRLNDIVEMHSLRRQIMAFPGFWPTTNLYTLFLWLLPLTFAYCTYKSWQERLSFRLLFWVASICGLTMLSMQFRLHYFGSFALYVPWAIMLDEAAARHPQHRKRIILSGALGFLLLCGTSMRYQLLAQWPTGNDPSFQQLRPILTTLREACARKPGIVLSDNDAGHLIRYYTECSVIANNFLLTPQHADKIREMDRLLSLKAADFPSAAPYVSYVLVRPSDIYRMKDGSYRYVSFSPTSSDLLLDLLIAPPPLDPRYRLLGETILSKSDNIPYARLYEVDLTP